MKIGKFYVDPMPVDDSSDDTYCRVFTGDPNTPGYDDQKGEIDTFTVTEPEEQAYGSLDAAIAAYMRRYHPGNDPAHQRRYRSIRRRDRRLQRDTYRLILDLLARYGDRITFYPAPDEDGCMEHPVFLVFYGKHNINPSIYITDVYLDGDTLRADGFDNDGYQKRDFEVYPEHYSDILYFISVALGFQRSTVLSRFISRVREKGMVPYRKIRDYLESRFLRWACRRAQLCTEYDTAVQLLKRYGLTVGEYGDYPKDPTKGYAYYTPDGRRDNPHGILIIYEFRQVGPDSYKAGKILSVKQR